jgi:hypothetical protein
MNTLEQMENLAVEDILKNKDITQQERVLKIVDRYIAVRDKQDKSVNEWERLQTLKFLYNALVDEARRVDWIAEDRVTESRTLLGWYIIEAMTMKSPNILDTWPRPEFDSRRLDVKVTINGVEVPVREVFSILGEHYEAVMDQLAAKIEDRARELIKEKYNDVYSALQDLEKRMNDTLPSSWQSSSHNC